VPESRVRRHRAGDDQDRDRDRRARVTQDSPARRLVDREEQPADGVLLLRVIPPDRHLVEETGEPARPECDEVHAREQHPQGRIEGEGQARSHEHGKVLGPGQGDDFLKTIAPGQIAASVQSATGSRSHGSAAGLGAASSQTVLTTSRQRRSSI